MRTRLLSWLPVAALALSSPAADAGNMIELRTDSGGSIETPFISADGKPVKATLAKITRYEDGTVEVEAVDLSESVEAYHSGTVGWEDAGPSLSIRVSNPLGISVSFGWVFGEVTPQDYIWHREGLLIEGEVGIGGGKVAVGYIDQSIVLIMPVGYDVKAALMQTWGSSWTVDPDQTYAGVEADFYYMFGKFTVGVYKRIAGNGPDSDDWLVSAGIGVGF